MCSSIVKNIDNLQQVNKPANGNWGWYFRSHHRTRSCYKWNRTLVIPWLVQRVSTLHLKLTHSCNTTEQKSAERTANVASSAAKWCRDGFGGTEKLTNRLINSGPSPCRRTFYCWHQRMQHANRLEIIQDWLDWQARPIHYWWQIIVSTNRYLATAQDVALLS